jgi:hypothetical protein
LATPFRLDRQRQLEREHHTLLPRRVALSLLALLCGVGLLNGFGQRTTVSRADGAAASISVSSPERVRGGLVFTSEYVVVAHQKLGDARVKLASGWFHGMTFNGVAPQPSNQASGEDGVTFDYGPVDAGQSMPFWISWQADPTTLGFQSQDVVLSDGATQLLSIHRTLLVFP